MNDPFITRYPSGLPAANNNNNNARTFINHNENVNNSNRWSVQATKAPHQVRRGVRFNQTVRSRAFNASNAPSAVGSEHPGFGRLMNGKNTRGRVRSIPAGNTRRNNAWAIESGYMMRNAASSPDNRPMRYATANNAHAAAVAHTASMAPAPAAPAVPFAAAANNNNNNNAGTCSGFGCFTRLFKGGRQQRRKTRRGRRNY